MMPGAHASAAVRITLAFLLLVSVPRVSKGEETTGTPDEERKPKPGKLSIKGYGLLTNLELRNLVKITQTDGKFPPRFDANFIEDAALILLSRLTQDGYLRATLTCEAIVQGTNTTNLEWTRNRIAQVPRDLTCSKLTFKVEKNQLYFFESLHFSGLQAISEKEAQDYFFVADSLIPSRKQRAYNRRRADQGMTNLEIALQRMGYAEAQVREQSIHFNDDTGEVQFYVKVDEGRKVFVDEIILKYESVSAQLELEPNLVWSRYWQQDFSQEMIHAQYRDGYPNAQLRVKETSRTLSGDEEHLRLEAELVPGPQVNVGEVRFEGHERTRLRRLKKRAQVEPGDLFNPLEIDEARQRMNRLGSFDSVGVRLGEQRSVTNQPVRDVTFELEEGKRFDLSLLLGVGSYERVRAGFELDQNNIFGSAHRYRLRGIQSFRATSSDFIYTMPDITSWELDAFINGEWLRREEFSFTRVEYGGGIGLGYFLEPIQSRVTARYNYQRLNAEDSLLANPIGLERAVVSSLVFDIKHDRRDNPITPRKGYKFFTNLEVATSRAGGSVDFQRLDMAASWHQPLGGGRYLHLGASHGVATTFGGRALDLPFNKRFFPGGENSVRGFQQGQASPLDAAGQIQGAATYSQGNIELEQMLTSAWSVVIFTDAVGVARNIKSYPAAEGLYSVGGGLRWKTIIGPARIEYGHNINARTADPRGSLHFSIGYPF